MGALQVGTAKELHSCFAAIYNSHTVGNFIAALQQSYSHTVGKIPYPQYQLKVAF
jgi:hypothetical protein